MSHNYLRGSFQIVMRPSLTTKGILQGLHGSWERCPNVETLG